VHRLSNTSPRLDDLLLADDVEPQLADDARVDQVSAVSCMVIVVGFCIVRVVSIGVVEGRQDGNSPVVVIWIMLEDELGP
jgi:hypothetical protein